MMSAEGGGRGTQKEVGQGNIRIGRGAKSPNILLTSFVNSLRGERHHCCHGPGRFYSLPRLG